MARRTSIKRDIVPPTPEQQAKAEYCLSEILDRSDSGKMLVLGKAYRRRPWFETMYERNLIGRDDLLALRWYRAAHEAADRSELKSCLNRTVGRGEAGLPPHVIAARQNLAICADAMGPVRDVVALVAIADMPFKQVAMAVYGTREQLWIKNGEHSSKIIPRSRSDVERVEQEFRHGLQRLLDSVRPYLRDDE